MDDQGKRAGIITTNAKEHQRVDDHEVPGAKPCLNGCHHGERNQHERHQCHLPTKTCHEAKSVKGQVKLQEVAHPYQYGVEEKRPSPIERENRLHPAPYAPKAMHELLPKAEPPQEYYPCPQNDQEHGEEDPKSGRSDKSLNTLDEVGVVVKEGMEEGVVEQRCTNRQQNADQDIQRPVHHYGAKQFGKGQPGVELHGAAAPYLAQARQYHIDRIGPLGGEDRVGQGLDRRIQAAEHDVPPKPPEGIANRPKQGSGNNDPPLGVCPKGVKQSVNVGISVQEPKDQCSYEQGEHYFERAFERWLHIQYGLVFFVSREWTSMSGSYPAFPSIFGKFAPACHSYICKSTTFRGLPYRQKQEHKPMNPIHAKKALGQHFLRDEGIAERIAHIISGFDHPVLEVGPGMGVLTKYLLEEHRQVKVVELDDESVDYLRAAFPDLRANIVHGDFLKLNLSELFGPGQPFMVIGNYPYNISSQIFFKILEYKELIPAAGGMLQREVARRLASPPGSKEYGILSVLLQAWYDVEYLFTVEPGVFSPPPKVKSGVIRLIRNDRKELGCDELLFKTVVKTTFNQRRKTLRNSLKPLVGNVVLPGEVDHLMGLRPEQMGVEDFVTLTNAVNQAKEE